MVSYYSLGIIVNTHNLKGDLRLVPHYPNYPFKKIKKVFVKHFGQYMIMELEKARPHKKFWLIKFRGHDRVEDVAKYKGESLFIESKKAPKISSSFYYWEEIIGCTLFNHRHEKYGKVVDILPSSGHPVYVVDAGNAYEKMIPAAKEFIKKIDRKKKKIFLTEAALSVLE
ncbi:MAG: ribosome maturation factor RimM [Candidatus Margulisbacteria bacterium]|nr:ribosome maturation factor RimM [Candidatus Margulisiibacteriota bacterium]